MIENKKLQIKTAQIFMRDITVTDDDRAYLKIKEVADKYRKMFSGLNIGSIPKVKFGRKLFKSIGIDPTKHRPSSEALLRRSLKNKDFFRINSLVDIGNYCSLKFFLPICVYDEDKIKGKISLRLGLHGEKYQAHNHQEINLENRFVLADDFGAFGSPITDSIRTAVTKNTQNALLVIFTPDDFDDLKLTEFMDIFILHVKEMCGGSIEKMLIQKP